MCSLTTPRYSPPGDGDDLFVNLSLPLPSRCLNILLTDISVSSSLPRWPLLLQYVNGNELDDELEDLTAMEDLKALEDTAGL